jgi:DNA polymerase I-like protein with 3'-5' exonuclease and polymerase domains
MQERTLGETLGIPTIEARLLLGAHRRTYSDFWAWSQRVTDHALLLGHLDTCFGWRLHVTSDTRPTSLLNHPMQSHGAEMLRLACCFVTEAGVAVCAPVHDALLIEAADSEIDSVVETAQRLMGRASRIVLGGFEVRTDAEIIRHPNRYADPRGESMWADIMKRIDLVADGREAAPTDISGGIVDVSRQDADAISISDES